MRLAMTVAECREQRERLRPLFDYMEDRGISETWLARRLWPDVDRAGARLWTYKHATARMPPDLVQRACRELGIPASWLERPRRARKAS